MDHVYIAHKCMFCPADELDQTVYGEYPCIDRQPLVYTSEQKETP